MVNLQPVDPVSPAAPYIGGKRVLARTIIGKINATPHDGYAEPFVGMGGIFLRRTMQPRMEAINDISGDVGTSSASFSATIRSSWRPCASRSPAGGNTSGW